MQIDWTLLLLLTVAVLFIGGLILALQTSAGRKRMGEAALALAERLIAYAIGWLEKNQTGGDAVDVPAAAAESERVDTLAKARVALTALETRRG